MHYITKNALRIWGTLGLLWCKFACIKKKNLRDPGPQAFGFLTSAQAVIETVEIVVEAEVEAELEDVAV